MIWAIRSVWALFFGMAMLMLGNGLQGSLLGLRADIEGFNATLIGFIMAGYFAGFMFGSIATPTLVSWVGHVRVFAALASLASTAVLLFIIFVHPVAWVLMRLLVGFCFAGLYVVAESWLNHAATNENRGQILSVYMVVMFGCIGAGQFMLNLADPASFELFIVVSALVSLSLVPISLTPASAPPIERPRPVSVAELFASSPLGTVACVGNGVATGAFLGMAPLYSAQLGLSVAQASLLLSVPFFGAVLSQYPLGLISDKLERRLVIIAVCAGAAGIALAGIVVSQVSFVGLASVFALFGALSYPVYSLAIAHTNDNLQYDQILGGGAKLVLLFGAGSTFGPPLVGVLMEWMGPQAFFAYLAAVNGALAVFAIYRRTVRAAVPDEEKGEFVFVAPRATPVAAASAIAEASADEAEETAQ